MASAMGKVIPTAKNAGVSIEQLGASYAIMTAKGIKSAESTTFLNSMFKELNSTGSDVDKALRQVSGKSFQELMQGGTTTGEALQMLSEYAEKSGKKLSDLFGSGEAGTAALTLLSNGVEGYNEQLKNMENSTGLCADAAETMGNTTASAWTEAKNRLDNAKASIGEALLPVLTQLANAISPIIEAITSWAEEHPELTKVIVLTVAAIGAFLVIGGTLMTFLGMAVIAMGAVAEAGGLMAVVIGALTSPITIVIGVIAALIGIAIALASNWDRVCKSISGAFKAAGDTISSIGQTIWDSITNLCNWMVEKIEGVIGVVNLLIDGFKNLVNVFKSGDVQDALSNSNAGNGNNTYQASQSSAFGTSYVPRDNMLYNLHQGEAVLARRDADKWRKEKVNSAVTIAKIADTVIIREEADLDKFANKLVRKINEQRIVLG